MAPEAMGPSVVGFIPVFFSIGPFFGSPDHLIQEKNRNNISVMVATDRNFPVTGFALFL